MGTDIHLVFQRKDNDAWVDIPGDYDSWNRLGGRDYQLFAVLAGVRNGTGFAGVRIGDAVTPIAEPRGWPEDFEVTNEHHGTTVYDKSGYPEDGTYMGYHDESWLTGKEMCDWYANAPVVTQTGVVDRAFYLTWDHKSRPDHYSGSVMGSEIKVANDVPDNPDAVLGDPKVTHVQVSWQAPLHDQLGYFFKEIEALVTEHGEVRMVFGFDS